MFLQERREKSLWDRISTVFHFHRDEKQLALYSQLYAWVIECRRESNKPETVEPLLLLEDVTRGTETAD